MTTRFERAFAEALARNAKPPKGSHRRLKARLKRQQAKARTSCRTERYRMAGGCCEECGKPLVLDVDSARSWIEIAHCHEVVPRSLGGDPTDVNGTRILCPACHLEAHS